MVLEKILDELRQKKSSKVFLENKFEEKVVNYLEKPDHIHIFLRAYEKFLTHRFKSNYCKTIILENPVIEPLIKREIELRFHCLVEQKPYVSHYNAWRKELAQYAGYHIKSLNKKN